MEAIMYVCLIVLFFPLFMWVIILGLIIFSHLIKTLLCFIGPAK